VAVAIKRVQEDVVWDSENPDALSKQLDQEIEFCEKLIKDQGESYIIRCFEIIYTAGCTHFVFELCESDLGTYVEKR